MDYKILIILLALLFIVVMIYRELSIVKRDLRNDMNTVLDDFKKETMETLENANNNMTRCINNIKELNNDNINQMRKVYMLNNQPITKVFNHYTETDESHATDNIKNTVNNSKKDSMAEFYLSDDDSSKQSCKKITENIKKIYDSNINTNQNPIANDENKSEKRSQYKEKKIENINIIIDENNNTIPPYMSTNNNDETKMESNICNIINKIHNEEILYSTTPINEVEDNTSITNYGYDNNDILKKVKNIGEVRSISNVTIANTSVVTNQQEKIKNEVFDEGKVEELEKEIIESINSNIEEGEKEDNKELIEYKIKGKTYTLEGIDNYKINDLRSIAKKLGLLLVYVENKKQKYYKKHELYENIKSLISSKK